MKVPKKAKGGYKFSNKITKIISIYIKNILIDLLSFITKALKGL